MRNKIADNDFLIVFVIRGQNYELDDWHGRSVNLASKCERLLSEKLVNYENLACHPNHTTLISLFKQSRTVQLKLPEVKAIFDLPKVVTLSGQWN